MTMVKPGVMYLDVVRRIKDKYPNIPLFVYQVLNCFLFFKFTFNHSL